MLPNVDIIQKAFSKFNLILRYVGQRMPKKCWRSLTSLTSLRFFCWQNIKISTCGQMLSDSIPINPPQPICHTRSYNYTVSALGTPRRAPRSSRSGKSRAPRPQEGRPKIGWALRRSRKAEGKTTQNNVTSRGGAYHPWSGLFGRIPFGGCVGKKALMQK